MHPHTDGQGATDSTAPAARSGSDRAIAVSALALAAVAALIATGALVIDFALRGVSGPANHVSAPAEVATAQRRLCDTYALVARAAQVDTAGSDQALARIATTNGALMLSLAAAEPALDGEHRAAALALADAYGILTAKGSYGISTGTEYRAALDDANAKDGAMRKVCQGGS
ncbi:hypothetical protein [Mycobacterium sp. 050134]|uniref:hypothetical protein n=1 Tax=Mycobacterium sp. 050134 TaxID=3096111 RepID=UPI002EDA5B34